MKVSIDRDSPNLIQITSAFKKRKLVYNRALLSSLAQNSI